MKSFECLGIWWLPENENEQISGKLIFNSRDGAKLELIGSFKDVTEFGKHWRRDLILGITTDGKKVTLYKCVESNSKFSFYGVQSSIYKAQVVFVGQLFNNTDEIMFDSLSMNFSYLEEWVGISSISISLENDKQTIICKRPDDIEMNVLDFKVKINFGYKLSRSEVKEYIVKQTTFISVELYKQISFSDFRTKIIKQFQNFLSLAVGKPVYPIKLSGKSSNDEQKQCLIEIYYPFSNIPDSFDTLVDWDMLFSYDLIKENLESCLNNWFLKVDILEPIYDLYFGVMYGASSYIQYQFLNLIQALESFHRRVYGGNYISESDFNSLYKLLVQSIPSNIEETFKEDIENKMKYFNELSLRKRLKDLLDNYEELFNLFIGNKKLFIDNIVNSRNYFTHYNRDHKTKAKEGAELYFLVQKLKIILEVCFLCELGLSRESVNQILTNLLSHTNLG